ncbi:MAG: heparinase II/III domain-containing protein [Planctomycetota bacterium]
MDTKYNRRDFLKMGTTAGTAAALGSIGISGHTELQKNKKDLYLIEKNIWESIEKESGLCKDKVIQKLFSHKLLYPTKVVDYSVWIENAERHIKHEYNLLGSGWVKVYHGMNAKGFEGNNYSDTNMTFEKAFNELPNYWKSESRNIMDNVKKLNPDYVPIDWQIDYKSGKRYAVNTHHSKVKYGVILGVDAKVPSALARSFHLVTLGLAYRHRKQKRYASELICQLLNWLAMNPPGRGAGWRGIMNVSIRTANWVSSVNLISDYLVQNRHNPQIDFFLTKYMTTLKMHGHFLRTNLELPETSIHPNHYIANITGLMVLAAATRGIFQYSDDWAKFASREMAHESQTQVLADGMDFECATAYQAFALEMFAYSSILTANSDPTFNGNYKEYLESNFGVGFVSILDKMAVLLAHVHKPSGHIPLAGDYDSGRLLKLEPPTIHGIDRRSVAFLVYALLGKNLKVPKEHTVAARLLIGDKVVGDKYKTGPALASRAFTTSGYYVMRNADKDHCFISCGPIGTGGKGGHAHNDKLSFELTANGKELFVDPGVYVYTASLELRNMARTTRNHNTIMIDSQEQNRFATKNKWWGCLEETRCRCLKWKTSADKDVFIGEHYGYEKLTPPITHRREIVLDKTTKQLIIADKLTAQGPVQKDLSMEWNFMLHPDCKVTKKTDGSITIVNKDTKVTFTNKNGNAVITDGWYSPAYGVRLHSERIRIENPFISENRFKITW